MRSLWIEKILSRRSWRSNENHSPAIVAIQCIPQYIVIDRLYPRVHCNFLTSKMASGSATVLFLEETQKYDCLYNKFSKDYKNKFKKMNCWTKIAEKLDMSPCEVEKKFKNIRTAYGRFLKKKSVPSGSGRGAVPLPREFTNLDWLQAHINHRPTVSNVVHDSPLSVEGSEEEQEKSDKDETREVNVVERT